MRCNVNTKVPHRCGLRPFSDDDECARTCRVRIAIIGMRDIGQQRLAGAPPQVGSVHPGPTRRGPRLPRRCAPRMTTYGLGIFDMARIMLVTLNRTTPAM